MQQPLMSLMVVIALIFTLNTHAQVGVGTTSPTEALEVVGNYKDSSFSSTWKSDINGGIYTIDYIVIYNGAFYKNLTGINTNIDPSADVTNWKNITPAPEYLHANMSSNENVATGNNIDNLDIISSSGNVGIASAASFSANTGQVTLTAGTTYKLTAALNITTINFYTSLVYVWYNITDGAEIGNPAFIYPSNRNILSSDQPTAIAYITPTVTTIVDLRIKSMGGGPDFVTIDADYGYITVEAL